VRRRRRRVPVGTFDARTGRWIDDAACGAVTLDALSIATFNSWFDDYHATQRYLAIADLLSRRAPDVMVFQEVTPTALTVFLAQPWIREGYRRAEVTGGDLGNYGMLLLSRLPIDRVTYTRLPTRLSRGYLLADLVINGRSVAVAAIHLESGKASARLRARQLRRIFCSLRRSENAIVAGDFNMRDAENGRVGAPFRDVWTVLRPHDDGFTEDTSINLMRLDSKGKHRQVRFDRVLLKGDAWVPAHVELLGTEPISSALPRVFPSDHFGVRCDLAAAPTGSNVPGSTVSVILQKLRRRYR
jgi:endonuclease/exonuclease/phosphatase family metal-dependent hydrolase